MFFGYLFRRVQVNKDVLKLNGTHQILEYTDIVKMLGGIVHTTSIKENTEALLVARKETGLKLIVDTFTYMVMFRCQIIAKSHNSWTDNIPLEKVEHFK